MSVTELFALLVIRHKVMTMTEFYEADAFDIDLMASHLDQAERDASERLRMMVWAALAPNLKKGTKPQDIMSFGWEREEKTATVTTKEQFDQVFKNFKKA